MQKRNILYELKDQLSKGTIQSQIEWCYDQFVQSWSVHYYALWNKVVSETPNVATRKKITGNPNRKKGLPGPARASLHRVSSS